MTYAEVKSSMGDTLSLIRNRCARRIFFKEAVSAGYPEVGLRFVRPGLRFGPCPVRGGLRDRRTRLDRLVTRSLNYCHRAQYTEKSSREWLESLERQASALANFSAEQRDANRVSLAHRFRYGVSPVNGLDDALAYACVAVEKSLGLRPRNNQRLATRAMLHGNFVEMATGEGKTLSLALAAAVAALHGTPVHVLTANDYLAARDAVKLDPFYRFLGLRVASAVSTDDPEKRREAYAADVVYVTAKQVAFDWLNDVQHWESTPGSLVSRMGVLAQVQPRAEYRPMLRGLCLALLDEADSLLVDEARIPLVLAAAVRQVAGTGIDTEAAVALGLAEQLTKDTDFILQSNSHAVRLTASGRDELKRISKNVADLWQSSRYREESVEQALIVLYRFERDRDYIVRDGQVQLLDVHTGRALADRRLPKGMHRLLEFKEKCRPSSEQKTIASLPFQQFFRRYDGLAGISGTLLEVHEEIHHVYGREIVRIQSHRPSRRVEYPTEVFTDKTSQLEALLADVRIRQDSQQPVLVCTRSVEQSIEISALLTTHGFGHQVLNAYQDAQEAAIVAAAGCAGQLTVATNIAGRGTDIPLGEGVSDKGGLHVISLAFNDARRLDRQLLGRAARQGDPGSYKQYISLNDPYLKEAMPLVLHQLSTKLVEWGWQNAVVKLTRVAQKNMERRHRRERLTLYSSIELVNSQLAFGSRLDLGS